MSKRTKWLLVIGVIATLIVGWQVAAFAIHDEVFELDGNATDETAAPNDPNNNRDDWENVFENTDSADDTAFVTETSRAQSVFTGGGSKDESDVPNWLFKGDGGLPDKDNLLHSYAALYTVGTTELLYFGADRFDNSGDAALGFWFFQSPVALNPPNATEGSFTGNHTEGDLLVISNFSNGGQVSEIFAYTWNPDCGDTLPIVSNPDPGDCAGNNLELELEATNATCGSPTATQDDACAIVNQGTITMPWDFDDKTTKGPGAAEDSALKSEFFEGGIDLGAIGLADACFTTALAETRSSTSTDAVLKDFTIGPFGDCESTINTVPVKASDNSAIPAGGVTPGTAVKDGATITVTGTTTWAGTLEFFLCAPNQLDAQGLCSTGGTKVGATQNISQATGQPIYSDPVNTAASPLSPGKYCFRGVFTSQTTGVPSQTDFDSSECFTVADTYSIATAQSFRPQNKATITTAGGTAVAGTVDFKLYNSLANCQANGATGLLYEETVTNVSGPSPKEVNTTNDGVDDPGTTAKDGITITTPGGTLYWRVAFTPTDTNITGQNSVCVEDSSVTIDDTTAPPAGP